MHKRSMGDVLIRITRLSDPANIVRLGGLQVRSTLQPAAPLSWMAVRQQLGLVLPDQLIELWSRVGSCRLFEDTRYGQWGLCILDPMAALESTRTFRDERPRNYKIGDLIVGTFLGDADLVLVRCDPSDPDFGRVLIALPIDPRSEWPCAGEGVSDFIGNFLDAGGRKFWPGA
jgi:hypothetical protein